MTARRPTRKRDAKAALLEHCDARVEVKADGFLYTRESPPQYRAKTRRLLNRLLREEREAGGKESAVRALDWVRQAGILSATDEDIERWASRAAVLGRKRRA